MKFELLHDLMRGEHALVVAPGPSALRVSQDYFEGHWTFGCNRAVAFCRPDFAVCVEPARDRVWSVIRASRPTLVFTHTDRVKVARAVHIDRDLVTYFNTERTQLRLGMSPFYGTAVAMLMGFDRIGLVGVDLDGNERFSNPNFQREWEDKWGELNRIAIERGQDIVNLNTRSKLQAVAKVGESGCIKEKL